jgi:hypothetical protein
VVPQREPQRFLIAGCSRLGSTLMDTVQRDVELG